MYPLALLGLLGAAQVLAHPTVHHGPSSLRRRTVDLEAFRLKATAQYVNATEAVDSASASLAKRETYVDTAVALAKSLVPSAEFRVVEDHYVGTNGIAHVNLKQTVHGLDIDNADFNINVRIQSRNQLDKANNHLRSLLMAQSSHTETTSSRERSPVPIRERSETSKTQ